MACNEVSSDVGMNHSLGSYGLVDVEESGADRRMVNHGSRSAGGKGRMKGGPWHPQTQPRV